MLIKLRGRAFVCALTHLNMMGYVVGLPSVGPFAPTDTSAVGKASMAFVSSSMLGILALRTADISAEAAQSAMSVLTNSKAIQR